MEICIPNNVKFILDKLNINFKAYIVGGCIRNTLLNLPVNDWDITTSAQPKEVLSIFKNLGYKTTEKGIKFGTVSVIIDNEEYEITTFRNEGKYNDFRHPEEVNFVTSLEEDLSRRDFTINAIAYNQTEKFIDPFNGIEDIHNKIIRCVDPNLRFSEDPLRMLRAIRFLGQLNFSLQFDTNVAIKKNIDLIKKISTERIRNEFNKILSYDKSLEFIFNNFYCLNVIDELFTNMSIFQKNPYHLDTVRAHTAKAVRIIKPELILRLTMLLHDCGKYKCKKIDENGIEHFHGHASISAEIAEKFLKKYKYDNKTINEVITLIKNHDLFFEPNEHFVKHQLNKFGEKTFRNLIEVRKADILSQNLIYSIQRLNKVYMVERILNNILKEQQCFQLKDLAVNGYDLMELGYRGIQIGDILNDLLNSVIDNKILNNKESLIKEIKERDDFVG